MYADKKIVVVMPAYNAADTLLKTYEEVMAQSLVDLVIVVDDNSQDDTVAIARTLADTKVAIHPENQGYGANQKTCYRLALEAGADIVIMVHPDYQYTPKLIPAMACLIGSGLYHCVLGSRILGGSARKGGMPIWKYLANRFLHQFPSQRQVRLWLLVHGGDVSPGQAAPDAVEAFPAPPSGVTVLRATDGRSRDARIAPHWARAPAILGLDFPAATHPFAFGEFRSGSSSDLMSVGDSLRSLRHGGSKFLSDQGEHSLDACRCGHTVNP